MRDYNLQRNLFTYKLLFIFIFLLEHAQSNSDSRECVCGKVPQHPRIRIAGGKAAKSNDYPWQIGLFSSITFRCGGSIITIKHFLTAAHCVTGFTSDWYAQIGMHDVVAQDGTKYEIDKVVIHENYNHGGISYDIAVGVLKNEIIFNKKAWPICLPSKPNEEYEGLTGFIVGWGKLSHRGVTPRELHMAEVKILSSEKCFQTRVGKVLKPNLMLCAYTLGADACQGDSGGPLFVEDSMHVHEILGITSFGIGCAFINAAGVYTRVTYFIDWIKGAITNTSKVSLCKRPSFEWFMKHG